MVSVLAVIALGCVIGCDQRDSELTFTDEPMLSAPAPGARSISYTIPEWGVRFGSVQSVENYPIWTTNAANKVYALATGINNYKWDWSTQVTNAPAFVETNHHGQVRIEAPGSLAIGNVYDEVHAKSSASLALGANSIVENAYGGMALGIYAHTTNQFAFVYGGDYMSGKYYGDHGGGTFNLNPIGGLTGVWIGETNLQQIIRMEAKAMIAEALADIDTNIQTAEDARVALTNLITILKNGTPSSRERLLDVERQLNELMGTKQ